MANVLCVLYDDPAEGYPPPYPRDDIPQIDRYPGGQTTPSPERLDFRPGSSSAASRASSACGASWISAATG